MNSLLLTRCGETKISKVSGGELRRVGVAEALISGAPIVCLLEPCTGLDSSTAVSLLSVSIDLIARLSKGVVMAALQQPDASLLPLFDDALVVRGERVLYHGPTGGLDDFFFRAGFPRPPTSPPADHAEYIAWVFLEEERLAALTTAEDSFGDSIVNFPPSSPVSPHPWNALGPCLPFSKQFTLLLPLLFKQTARNPAFLFARLIFCVVMGLILLTLFIGVPLTNYPTRFGLALFSAVYFSFQNQAEVGLTFALFPLLDRRIRNGRLYSPWAFWWAFTLASTPFTLMGVLFFTSLTYWPLGWSPQFDRYLFFFATLFLIDTLIRGLFVCIAFVGPPPVAQAATVACITFLLLFSGVYEIRGSTPSWMQWIFYIDPYFYTLVALTNNEFLSPSYTPQQAAAYMAAYDFPLSFTWQWLSFLFLFLVPLFLFLLILPVLTMLAPLPLADEQAHLTHPQPPPSQGTQGHFPTPRSTAFLQWEALTLKIGDRNVLNGVSGKVSPGDLMVLMGGSGAGKTSLLRVLAFRTQGKVTGSITLNGEELLGGTGYGRRLLKRELAFAEQIDSHYQNVSVRDALRFVLDTCGHLWPTPGPSSPRAAADTTTRGKVPDGFLDELLLDLGFGTGETLVKALSGGGRKKLSFGIALCSGCRPLLFADEPASGLSGVESLEIFSILAALASKQYTVIATVHQPSQPVFNMFTHVTLLGRDGRSVYCGKKEGCIEELSRLYGQRMPQTQVVENESTWIIRCASGLEVTNEPVGSGTASGSTENRVNVRSPVNPVVVRGWPPSPPYGRIFCALLSRNVNDTYRAKTLQRARLGVVLGQAVLIGLLSLYIAEDTFQGTQSVLGFFLGSLILTPVALLSSGLALWSTRKAAVKRELSSDFYPASIFVLAQSIGDLPFILGFTLLFCLIAYPIAHLTASPYAAVYFFFCLAIFLQALFFAMLSYVYLIAAPSPEVAQMLTGIGISMCVLFAGLFIQRPNIPPGWQGMYYAVPTSHILRALGVAEFYCTPSKPESLCSTISLPSASGSSVKVLQFSYVLAFLGLSNASSQFLFNELGWASLAIVVVAVCVHLVSQVWQHRTQY